MENQDSDLLRINELIISNTAPQEILNLTGHGTAFRISDMLEPYEIIWSEINVGLPARLFRLFFGLSQRTAPFVLQIGPIIIYFQNKVQIRIDV
jgi:hypothetical protein